MTSSNETFSMLLTLYTGNLFQGHLSPHKGTVTETFDVSLLSVWTNYWTNPRLTGNYRLHDDYLMCWMTALSITWTNVDTYQMYSDCGIHLWEISQEVFINFIKKVFLEITLLKSLPHLLGAMSYKLRMKSTKTGLGGWVYNITGQSAITVGLTHWPLGGAAVISK